MWDPAFGKLHVCHEFEALDNGALEAARRGFLFAQNAIDAVSDPEPGFHRFEVDIGRAGNECPHNDLGAKFDDGGVFFACLSGTELIFESGIVVVRLGRRFSVLLFFIPRKETVELLDFGEVLFGVECSERLQDLLRRNDDALDVFIEDGTERIERLEIHRVRHCDRQNAIGFPKGDDPELSGEFAGEQVPDIIAENESGNIVKLHSEGRCQKG